MFCASTELAVREFQTARGLFSSGACDEQTWLALVEASWRLGDRLLLLTSPNLRGDDVAELQTALGRLGFDCGRVDGIFGPLSARALADFQRNCGLLDDGVCGTDTARALHVLARQSGTGPGVATVRELDALSRVAPSLDGLRVVVGQFGGLSSLTRMVAQELRTQGAKVLAVDEPDASTQAAVANRFGAASYVGFDARPEPVSTVAYYSVPAFESAGGRSLACRIVHQFDLLMNRPATMVGMRLSVLRETRMPAVQCTLGPVREVVDQAPQLTEAIAQALADWAKAPLP